MADVTSQDQRQRTLQALERRFESAKVELDLHQTNNIKRFKTDEAAKKPSTASSSALSSSLKSTTTPCKKGNFIFSGYVNSQDIDESGPTYAKFSQQILEELITASDEVSGGNESRVDNVLHELLQSGDSAQKYMQGSRSKKIDNWMLLDNYVQGRGGFGNRAGGVVHKNSKRSRKRMSMKQQKKNGLFELPQEFHSYDKFKPMHEMWKDYIAQLLKITGKTQLAQSLLTADLHGAILSVADCKVTSYTGVSGIMIRETAETFGIITRDNKFRVVPKRLSVFIFQVDCWKITLHGDKLTSRSLGS